MKVVSLSFYFFLLIALALGRPGRSRSNTNNMDFDTTTKGSQSGDTGDSSSYSSDTDSDRNGEESFTGNREGDDEIENTYEYDEKGKGVYDKIDQFVYPYQQYVQVRHSFSVEHLPIQEPETTSPVDTEDDQYDETSSSNKIIIKKSKLPKSKKKSKTKSRRNKSKNLITSATNDNNQQAYDEEQDGESDDNNEDEEHTHGEVGHGHGSHDEGSSYSHGYKPRLTEEIENYKKQEVYEEKGYADGAYDHNKYGEQQREDYQLGDKGDNDRDNYHEQSSPSQAAQESRRRTQPHLSQLPSSTKILEFAASNLYDKDAHEKGIYAARENIHCQEVIDFDLSSKKMGMGKGGRAGKKPRLGGLGDKIKCLKEKYFGVEPLPSQIFMQPSESRQAAIQIPSFDQFYKSFTDEFGSFRI